jgi:hypothetical protein
MPIYEYRGTQNTGERQIGGGLPQITWTADEVLRGLGQAAD